MMRLAFRAAASWRWISCAFLVGCSSNASPGAAPGDAGPSVGPDASAEDAGDSATTGSNTNDSGGVVSDSSIVSGDSGSDGESINTSCPPYSVEGDSISDSSTGLTWRNSLSGPEDWATADTDCGAWGGRIPTESEATSLVQAIEASSCAAQIKWPAPPAGQGFWTSTLDPQNASFYYTAFFGGGMPIPVPATDGHWVVCVTGTDVGGDL
jgi:hypothetical protein